MREATLLLILVHTVLTQGIGHFNVHLCIEFYALKNMQQVEL